MELQIAILVLSACLGFISVSKFLVILSWTWAMFLRPPKNLKEYGPWASVTGSTDGIGQAIAIQLAATGLNLVLLGRSPAKLDITAEGIQQKSPGIGVRKVVIDFANYSGEEISKTIEEAIRGLNVGILINNAGLAYPYARFFHEVDSELIDSVLRVNIQGTTWVTRIVLSGMMERRKGTIVNIGSASLTYASSYPLYTVYAATKAYVALLSKSMNVEYKHRGIDVLCQIPFLVATKMSSIKKPSLFVPSAEEYGKASVRWIGHHHQICIPYRPHILQAAGLSLLPESVLDWCLMRYLLGMRARGMRKDQGEKSTLMTKKILLQPLFLS